MSLIFAEIVLGLITQAVREYVLAKLRIGFQEKILALLLRKEYSATVHFHSGELLNRMFSDVGIVTNGIVSILPSVSYLAFQLMGAAVVLMMLAPEFTFLFLVIGIMLCLVMTLLRGKLKFLHKRVQETEARVLRNLEALQDRTCLIVTHRRAALSICNKHLLLKDGRVEWMEEAGNPPPDFQVPGGE